MDIFRLTLNEIAIHNLTVLAIASASFLIPLMLMFYILERASKDDELLKQKH